MAIPAFWAWTGWAKETGMFGGVLLPAVPPGHEVMPLFHDRYEPLWSACDELDLPLAHHVGTGNPETPMDQPASNAVLISEMSIWAQRTLGHLIDGTQAEQVRVPFADRALHRLPDAVTDEQALLLADILPTAYEVGVRNGRVRPGATVAIVGAGPIGLAAIMTARLMTPSRIVVIDPASGRREAAERLGADLAVPDAAAAFESMKTMTDGLGFDSVIEAVGIPETFELCADLVRPGGTVANVGVHGASAALHLERLWIRNVTITTGLVDTSSTPTLLRLLADGRLATEGLVTHRFGLDEIQDAYDVFERPQDTGALKVALFHQ